MLHNFKDKNTNTFEIALEVNDESHYIPNLNNDENCSSSRSSCSSKLIYENFNIKTKIKKNKLEHMKIYYIDIPVQEFPPPPNNPFNQKKKKIKKQDANKLNEVKDEYKNVVKQIFYEILHRKLSELEINDINHYTLINELLEIINSR